MMMMRASERGCLCAWGNSAKSGRGTPRPRGGRCGAKGKGQVAGGGGVIKAAFYCKHPELPNASGRQAGRQGGLHERGSSIGHTYKEGKKYVGLCRHFPFLNCTSRTF